MFIRTSNGLFNLDRACQVMIHAAGRVSQWAMLADFPGSAAFRIMEEYDRKPDAEAAFARVALGIALRSGYLDLTQPEPDGDAELPIVDCIDEGN